MAVDKTSRSPLQKTTIQYFKLNLRASEDLILATEGSSNTGKVDLSLVYGDKMIDLPDSNAAMAYKKLRGKYTPQSALSYIRLNKIFINTELPSVNNDPEIFLTELKTMIGVNKCAI